MNFDFGIMVLLVKNHFLRNGFFGQVMGGENTWGRWLGVVMMESGKM